MIQDILKATELNSAILDNLPLLVAYLDRNQVYHYANQNYQHWVNQNQENIIGKTKRQIVGEDAYQKIQHQINLALTGQVVKYEDLLKYANGTRRYVHVTYIPHFSPDQEVIGFFSFIRDITEQRQHESRLQIQEEKLQNIINSTPGIVWESRWDAKRKKLTLDYISAYVETLLGYPTSDLTAGKDLWSEIIHPDDLQEVKRKLLQLIDTKVTNVSVPFRFIKKDGDIIFTEARCSVIVDHSTDSVTGIRGVTVDVTQRKKAEDALHFLAEASKILSSSLSYQDTLHKIAKLAVPMFADWCAVDMLNSEGKVELVAVAHQDAHKVQWAQKLRQSSPIALDATSGTGRVISSGQPEFYPLITEEMIRASATDQKTYDLIQGLGFCSVIIVPLVVQKKTIGAISFVTTESRRHYDETDFHTAQELAHRASMAVENATLYQESQQAVQLRDEFLSIASHELKTPVTSLKLYTQMLRKKMKADPLVSYAEKMERQVDKLTRLIIDLLTVSKIEFGQLVFHKEKFDFHQLVEEITQQIQQTTDHQIVVHNLPLPLVYGDRERIGQVITNLLTNAVKYSPSEKPVLLKVEQKKDTVNVTVHDQGIGIDAANHEKIFDRFYQVNEPTEKTYPGLGIGLYISRQIARNHDGDVTVKSAKGKGSTFILTLPINSHD